MIRLCSFIGRMPWGRLAFLRHNMRNGIADAIVRNSCSDLLQAFRLFSDSSDFVMLCLQGWLRPSVPNLRGGVDAPTIILLLVFPGALFAYNWMDGCQRPRQNALAVQDFLGELIEDMDQNVPPPGTSTSSSSTRMARISPWLRSLKFEITRIVVKAGAAAEYSRGSGWVHRPVGQFWGGVSQVGFGPMVGPELDWRGSKAQRLGPKGGPCGPEFQCDPTGCPALRGLPGSPNRVM